MTDRCNRQPDIGILETGGLVAALGDVSLVKRTADR
jgi:hypothetical protein